MLLEAGIPKIVLRLVPYREGGPVFPKVALYQGGLITTVTDRWLSTSSSSSSLAYVSYCLSTLADRMEIRTTYDPALQATTVLLRPVLTHKPQLLDKNPPPPDWYADMGPLRDVPELPRIIPSPPRTPYPVDDDAIRLPPGFCVGL